MIKHQSTLKEIASELNVSISTVSRALNNNPRIGLRTRMLVQEVALKLNYIPNAAAQLLRKSKTLTIGVVLPYVGEEFFALAITGIEDVIATKGYSVLISQSRDSYEREVNTVQSFIRSRVDGVLASISAKTDNYQHFKELQNFGIPLVFFDRIPTNFVAHQVCGQVEQAAEDLVAFLAARGLRRIAIVNGPIHLDISKQRLMGFIKGTRDHGIDVPPEMIASVDLTQEDTAVCMERLCLRQRPPEAILGFNDEVCLQAMQWCMKNGLVPNKDIYFVSYGNLPKTAFMQNPPLASIEQYPYKMGMKAAELLLQVIEQPYDSPLPPQQFLIETKLIEH
ncbi:MAG: LacI family DNA-binding transcriptional regulator [Saprospiraceae bacterium]